MTSFVDGDGDVVADLWTVAPVRLDELCGRLSHLLGLEPFLHDAENVWEWGYTQTEESRLEINVTRKHDIDDEPLLGEPIRVMLLVREDVPALQKTKLRDEWVPRLGEALATLTGQKIYAGRWEYLKGDEFVMKADTEFIPRG